MVLLKEKWAEFRCKLFYLVNPFGVIGTCLAVTAVIDAICVFLIARDINTPLYDVLLAILTGFTASAAVAIFIEMANNYQCNEKRWLQMAPLFNALTNYEQELQIWTKDFDSSRATIDFQRRLHSELVREGSETQEKADTALKKIEKAEELFGDDLLEKCDRVEAVFEKLPELIPLLRDAYTNHSDLFRRPELESMALVLSDHHSICRTVKHVLMSQSGMKFGRNRGEEEQILSWLSPSVLRELDDGLITSLAIQAWEKQLEQLAETLVDSGPLKLNWLGIKLSDQLVDIDIDDESEITIADGDDDEYDLSFSRIISIEVAEIDRELATLQKIIRTEPSFNTWYEYNCRFIKQYGKSAH